MEKTILISAKDIKYNFLGKMPLDVTIMVENNETLHIFISKALSSSDISENINSVN